MVKRNRSRWQTLINKTLHKKLKIDQSECMCSGRVAVPAPSQESMRSCIHVLWISMLSISTILRLDFGNVLTVWYVLLSFHSNKTVINCIGDKPKDNEHLQFLPSKSIMGIIPVTTDSFSSNFFFLFDTPGHYQFYSCKECLGFSQIFEWYRLKKNEVARIGTGRDMVRHN